MESITLQMMELELENYIKMDLEKKMDITANIIERLQTTSTQEPNEDKGTSIETIASLTGVDIAILEQIGKLDDVSRKFNEWENEEDVSASMNNLYKTMTKQLQVLYTNNRKIPTKLELLDESRESYTLQFRALLNKYFTTVQLPGTHHSLIVEKPEIVLNREKFMRKKLDLLREGKTFVYIEDVYFQRRGRCSFKMINCKAANGKRLVLAVSPEVGYVSSICCLRMGEANLKHWLEEKLIPVLPPECVLVVEDGLFEGVPHPPQSHAAKKEMVDWLTHNDIPHDPQSHRAELYALIEIYTKTCSEIAKLDAILQPHGHTALRRKEGVVFEYLEPFWKKVLKILYTSKGSKIIPKTPNRRNVLPQIAKKLASVIQKEYWQALHENLLDIEMNAYKKDQEMEQLIDQLLVYAASDQFDPEEIELDDYCEAMNREYIFT